MKNKLKISANAPVTLAFTFICFAALILNYLTGGISNGLLFSVYRAPLTSPFTWLRFIGHVFGHSGWEHLIGNIMLLLIVGPLLEEKYGPRNIIIVILSTALVTGIVHFILFPNVALLGASGVVFAMILLSSFTSIREGTIPLTFILVALLYIGQQVLQGVFVSDNISNLTHILGGFVGAFIGFRLNYQK